MIGISEREAKENSRQGEKDLKKREAGLVNRNETVDYSPKANYPRSVATRGETEQGRPSAAEVKANLERVGSIIKSIGGDK